MKQAQLRKANEGILAFSGAQGEATKATRQMWSALIPLVVSAVKAGRKKPGYKDGVPHGVIKTHVLDMLHEYYQSSATKRQLAAGRHIADGAIVLAVNDKIVDGAIDWAYACEVLQLTVRPKHMGPRGPRGPVTYLLKKP